MDNMNFDLAFAGALSISGMTGLMVVISYISTISASLILLSTDSRVAGLGLVCCALNLDVTVCLRPSNCCVMVSLPMVVFR
jgi:hypothetical protein